MSLVKTEKIESSEEREEWVVKNEKNESTEEGEEWV